jgi:hypothetical protein
VYWHLFLETVSLPTSFGTVLATASRQLLNRHSQGTATVLALNSHYHHLRSGTFARLALCLVPTLRQDQDPKTAQRSPTVLFLFARSLVNLVLSGAALFKERKRRKKKALLKVASLRSAFLSVTWHLAYCRTLASVVRSPQTVASRLIRRATIPCSSRALLRPPVLCLCYRLCLVSHQVAAFPTIAILCRLFNNSPQHPRHSRPTLFHL